MLISKGTISNLQREILSFFSTLADSQMFYLSGGTALADFYLMHRRSYDLDIFTIERELILPFSYIFEAEAKEKFQTKVIRRFETFVEFELFKAGDSLKVQIAYDSPYRFEKPIDSDLGIKVNDYKDLITDKLLAFFGRAEPRDAIDLFFILQREPFDKLIQFASTKDTGFDLYWLAIALEKTLSYPDEIASWPVEMLMQVDIKEVKVLFSRLAMQIMELAKKP